MDFSKIAFVLISSIVFASCHISKLYFPSNEIDDSEFRYEKYFPSNEIDDSEFRHEKYFSSNEIDDSEFRHEKYFPSNKIYGSKFRNGKYFQSNDIFDFKLRNGKIDRHRECVVDIFEHREYRGHYHSFRGEASGCVNIPNHFNDKSSAVRQGRCCNTFFHHNDCRGKGYVLCGDHSAFPSNLEDKISAIKFTQD